MLNRFKNIFRKHSGIEIADTLDSMGYFQYADPSDVELLKQEISNAYEAWGMISSIHALENGIHYPKDYRLYSLDNEALFEQGGYHKYLAEIEPTTKKLNISIYVEDELEEYSPTNGITHSLSINGVKYRIFEQFRDFSRAGTIAAKKFIEIINNVLVLQQSHEKVYPIGSGTSGQLIFLTPEQFRFIYAVYPDNDNKPLPLKEWARKHGIR
ncbi:hypothetical protein [Cesiribacter sp. SM1]|uniref:hypothetical protein n=1 Tax=Cesiribacter sp. SM1 TaxID=2861196 RepID=UPI001CD8088D|nr:hypothetical protein [Cesiribacter sp. SM1]